MNQSIKPKQLTSHHFSFYLYVITANTAVLFRHLSAVDVNWNIFYQSFSIHSFIPFWAEILPELLRIQTDRPTDRQTGRQTDRHTKADRYILYPKFAIWSIKIYWERIIVIHRTHRFLAVLRSFYHSSPFYTLSFDPFPPNSLPSSLNSSCHLFLGLPDSHVVSKFSKFFSMNT